jgi:GMP synthase (glutamine-hydrolysing)
MRNILVLQHVPHEILGTLNPLLKKHGFRIRYVNFGRDPNAEPNLEGYNGLIILGGPMGAYEGDKYPHIKTELRLIEDALKKNIPILGICLGSQLIAKALQSGVKPHHSKEIGWHEVSFTEHGRSDSLFKKFNKSEQIFQLHGDTFDVPNGTHHLAFSKLCEGQAFRYGDKVYGLQFHLEVDEAMILRWLKVPQNQRDLAASAPLTEEEIIKQTTQHISRSLELSHEAFSNFIQLFNLPERKIRLGSDHGKPGK